MPAVEKIPGHKITYQGIKFAVNSTTTRIGEEEITEITIRERKVWTDYLTRCYCCRDLDQGMFKSKRNMTTGVITVENHLSRMGKAVKALYEREVLVDSQTVRVMTQAKIDRSYETDTALRSHVQRNEGTAETGHQQANAGVMRAQTEQHRASAEAGGYGRFEGALDPRVNKSSVLLTNGGVVATGTQPPVVQQPAIVQQPTVVQPTTVVQPAVVQAPQPAPAPVQYAPQQQQPVVYQPSPQPPPPAYPPPQEAPPQGYPAPPPATAPAQEKSAPY